MRLPATRVRFDYGNGYSPYVADPDGNPVEITRYDHRAVERALKR
jgi:hypothetical protein